MKVFMVLLLVTFVNIKDDKVSISTRVYNPFPTVETCEAVKVRLADQIRKAPHPHVSIHCEKVVFDDPELYRRFIKQFTKKLKGIP